MAEEQHDEKAKPAAKKVAWWRSLNRKSVTALVAVSLLLHGVGYLYYRAQSMPDPRLVTPEITLGEFRFEAADNQPGPPIRSADFNLHISLLDEVDRAARARLTARRFKVQQDIEELLRQAHPADFQDPNLGELKRLLQEQINETIGLRAVNEVIITDLEVHRNTTAAHSAPKTATPADAPAAVKPQVSQREVDPPPFSF